MASSFFSNQSFESRLPNGHAAHAFQSNPLTLQVEVHTSLNTSPTPPQQQPIFSVGMNSSGLRSSTRDSTASAGISSPLPDIPEITVEDPSPDPSSHLEAESGGSGGGGNRLKNRSGVRGGVSTRYTPASTQSRIGDGEDIVEDVGGALSPNGSYNSVSSAATAAAAGDGAGRDGDGREKVAAPGKTPLTVEGTWKVETALKNKEDRRGSGVWKLAVAKWVSMLGLSLLLLGSLVSAKVAVLTLGHQLFLHRPGQDEEETDWSKYTAQYILLYIYLTVPPGLMWLRSVWYGCLDKKVPWPSKKAILLAVFSAGAESVGLCLMCYTVLGRYQTPVSLLLLSVVLLIPAFNVLPLARAQRRRGRVRPFTVFQVLVGILFLLLGTVGVGVLLGESASIDSSLWHPAAAIVCLSVAWLPSVQRIVSKARRQQAGPQQQQQQQQIPQAYGTFSSGSLTSNGYDTPTTLTTTNSTASSSSTNLRNSGTNITSETAGESRVRSGDLSTNAAWKGAFIENGCRLVVIFCCSALLYVLDSGPSPSNVLTDQVHQAFLKAWDLSAYVDSSASWVAFWMGLGSALLAYLLAYAACHMNMTIGALAPPVLLSMPLTLILVTVTPVCHTFLPSSTCSWEHDNMKYVVPTGVCLLLGHALVFGWYLFRTDPVLLLQECMVYYVPGYNGVNLDTWLTLNRRQEVSVTETGGGRGRRKPKVFICTTMYREEEDEMRQLLESIRHINEAQAGGDRGFESHIIFDNGVRQTEPSDFALTLIALLEETLGIDPRSCTKVTTPYGLKLSWRLPGPSGQQMAFNIHLKDNLLVKNKKRWSQVMYMSYVLDFLTEANDEAYILTTDADVVFTPESVEALLDLMTRDNSIGAVCARTHPMGGGPLVWYQVFEYAIGHWFQKTAEHALGSVLCAPGCFSVYRCQALADVLPKYAKRVETAFDFLTKDMGEDRWLCTLLVQSGWRIEYCAASENRTNCPGNFDEFYKQRRRWVASTLANLMLIVKEWKYVFLLNHRISVIFLLYQGLLLFSTLIGPSTVMLVVSGGLSYAWLVDPVTTVILQLLVCAGFCIVCIYTTPKTQLMVAKLYTFLYAIVMTAVVVGTAAQIVDDLDKPTPGAGGAVTPSTNGTGVTTTLAPNQHISVDLPMSVTTLYFISLVAIFLTAGMVHPREFYCLLHGVWYLLCLPSGYLVLTLYSICNITDSSWGTREADADKPAVKKMPWQQRLKENFYEVFFCCKQDHGGGSSGGTSEAGVQTVVQRHPSVSLSISEDFGPTSLGLEESMGPCSTFDAEAPQEELDELPDKIEPVPVEEWLPVEMRGRYLPLFKNHGFDSTLFIAGMTETELRRIGVTLKGHLRYLLDQITLIPAFEIEYKVPTNADEWLEEIGLPMYRNNFQRNQIRTPKEMEILKFMGRKEIENELGIIKDGHVKRLRYAIAMLRDPTEAQQKAMRMRQVIDQAPVHHLGAFNVEENDFWEALKKTCLEPDLKAFGLEGEVKAKLKDLRNEWLAVLTISNILWLILITTLASKASLTILGANPMGLVFLAVFGFLFVLQFLTMLLHRLYTVSHYLARAPYRCGRPMQSSWTFSSSMPAREDFEDTMDYTAVQQVKRDSEKAWERLGRRLKRGIRKARKKPRQREPAVETTPLTA